MIKNKTRWIPEGYKEFTPELGDYPKDMFACYVDVAKLSAIFYTGKQSSRTWYIRFRTEEDMKKKIKDTISRLMSWEEMKEERKEKRKAPHSLVKGNILYSSWGYDQTNINFYQVTKVVSDKTVELREICSKNVGDSNYGSTNEVVAVKDAFLAPRNEYDKRGLPILKRPRPDNTVKLSSYEWAWLWSGKPQQETASGWGH